MTTGTTYSLVSVHQKQLHLISGVFLVYIPIPQFHTGLVSLNRRTRLLFKRKSSSSIDQYGSNRTRTEIGPRCCCLYSFTVFLVYIPILQFYARLGSLNRTTRLLLKRKSSHSIDQYGSNLTKTEIGPLCCCLHFFLIARCKT